jgi:NADPH:quinone reductase-like Zn-dependent oxidoreductase
MSFLSIRNAYSQLFPPKPFFTEKEIPTQQGRIFIITGGNSGIGFELCKILYGTGATIYMTSRSKVSPAKRIVCKFHH